MTTSLTQARQKGRRAKSTSVPDERASVDTELATLLKELGVLAQRPVAQATAMPKAVYTSEQFLALEQTRIFEKEWLCAGRTDALRKPGDYLTYAIGSQPVFVVRTEAGEVRAFSNVCLHRMMRLLEGRGNCKRIVCPYHAWTYSTDGCLLRARYMEQSTGFDLASYRLPAVRCEVWEGWVYITLNPDAPSICERLGALGDIVGRYNMGDYVEILQEDHEWSTNWKLLTENFMEGYHLPVAHRETVGAYFPAEATEFSSGPPNDAFTFQWFVKTNDAPVGTAHPRNTRLAGAWRNTSVLGTVYPSHMFALAPDHMWYLSLQPKGPGKVSIRYGAAFAPEVLEASEDPERLIADTTAFLAKVQEEDRFVVEGIFQGAGAALSKPGPLSWLERENHEFTQYLARRLLVS
jgi:phenylpropionate dioxygenase-like ring-hydroxylating dioxygenase large terminal subunit